MWDYAAAFSRNLGLVTQEEQERLRRARVAICGLGGVGGAHLLTLLRLGVGRFTLAEPDRFELANLNRQQGATVETLGRPKIEVMAEMARSVNPEVELRLFPEGLTAANAGAVLDGADLALDGVDFFAMEARRLLFRTARARGLVALTAAPLGFGATLHCFTPQGLSFDDYFDLREGMSREEQLVAFAVGLAPRALHLAYLDLARVDLAGETGPSSSVAVQLAGALAGAEALALLLRRRPPRAAPHYLQVDPYVRRWVAGYLPGGNRHPWQRLKRWLLGRRVAASRPRS